jgi:hypothetical protein
MKLLRRPGDGLALATLAWTLCWCGDVAVAWRDAPYDRLGVIAAAGWIAFVWMAGLIAPAASGWWLAAAWVFSCAGAAGELNVAQHAGLALAGAAWAGGGRKGLAVLLLAAGWMPALGWSARGAGADFAAVLRVLAGAAGALLAWRERKKYG